MNGWSNSRRGGLADPGEKWFRCNLCPAPRWLPGGPIKLGAHVLTEHGLDVWPTTETVDSEEFVLDTDGNRLEIDGEYVRASTEATGWIKTRPTTSRLYRGGVR